MAIDDLKNELVKLNAFIYFDDNEYLREKCSDELVLKEIIEKFEENIHSLSNPPVDELIFLHGNIGNLYRILGNTQQAINNLRIALELSDGNNKIRALIRLGEALKYNGQLEQALRKFDEAIDQCTYSEGSVLLDFAYQHKGKCLLELGQASLALDCFQKALEIRRAKGDQSLIASTQKAIEFTKLQGGVWLMLGIQHAIEGIKRLNTINRPYIVGMDGLSGAGKTTITETINEELIKAGYKVLIIHIDDLIEEREKRYNTGHPEWIEYYSLQWDVPYIKENFFEAVHKNVNDIRLKFYDAENDRCYTKTMDIEFCSIILIEGIFLQRKEWRAFFDYMIYLDCSREVRYQRALQRDTYIGDMNERLKKYEQRYWVAEDYYLKEENPLENSDIVIKGVF